MKKLIPYTAVLFLLAACSSKKTAEKEAQAVAEENIVVMTDAQLRNAGITTGQPVKQLLHSQLRVNGMVDVPPQNIVSVSFPMGGYLRSTRLLPGMHVSRGEVIAVVEDQALVQLQQDYLVARERLGVAEKEYERQKQLNENKVSADKIFQQAEADYHSQKVVVKALGERLRLIGLDPARLSEETISRSVPVLSPINGFVSKVNVNIGKYVTATDVLFELINPDDMHAALTVFEKDLTRVRKGQKVRVSFVDDPATLYDCEVILVTKNVDESRSALVHCHFFTQPKNLLPGMFLTAQIDISSEDAVTLPEAAVVRYDNRQWVFEAVGENRFRMVTVQTGVADQGNLEIVNPSAEFAGRKFAVTNAYALLSRMKNTPED